MPSDRWKQVEALFEAAQQRPADQRAEFLRQACPADSELCAEVESLLKAAESRDPLLDGSPLSSVEERAPGLKPGDKLGNFQIVALIGRGGMGEVYRARDLRLKRDVAIKTLPSGFAADRDRIARFEREARAASALNHPNIVSVYDIGQEGGVSFIVSELVDGETLARTIQRGPLPLRKLIEVSAQICDGLAAAHAAGVIHRDLKPGNIMLTRDRRVKILDFGLARQDRSRGVDSTTIEASHPGMIMGTPGYMSPEQVRGEPTEARTDIFSLGVILYEMACGKRAFSGGSSVEVMNSILKDEPAELPPASPPELDRIVRRCIEKEPARRFQSAADLGFALRSVSLSAAGTARVEAAPASGGVQRPWRMLGVAAILAIGLALVVLWRSIEKAPAAATRVRFQIQAPENTTLTPFIELSPDGRKVAFIVNRGEAAPFAPLGDLRLWVHFLESGESRDLTTADGPPFWSPDSRFIGYPSQNKLRKIEATGGSAQTISDLSGGWLAGAWNRDDVIVFGAPLGLFRVHASGGVPVQVTSLDPTRHETYHYRPSFLPDGRHFVYLRESTDRGRSAIYLGSVDSKPDQQISRPLVASSWGPGYAPSAEPSTGYLLFLRDRALMAQPFDNRRLEMTGQAVPVAEQLASDLPDSGTGAFSASANDVLAFWRSDAASTQQLTWCDREGKVLGNLGEPGDYQGLALSPDGTKLALGRASRTAENIWLLDLSRSTSTRFTFGSAIDADPVWSPDGNRIVFSSNRDGGTFTLYQKLVSGVKEEEVLLKTSVNKFPTSWSRDGRFLLYDSLDPTMKMDIWVLPLESDKHPVPFLRTEFWESDAHFSPDGHWVAYVSDESGQPEVYVRSFATNSGGTAVEVGGKWLISNGSGVQPRWRGDGRELFYRSPRDGKVMAVEVAAGPTFRPGMARPLGTVQRLPRAWPDPGSLWDSTADGRRFITASVLGRQESFTVVLNWQTGLKK